MIMRSDTNEGDKDKGGAAKPEETATPPAAGEQGKPPGAPPVDPAQGGGAPQTGEGDNDKGGEAKGNKGKGKGNKGKGKGKGNKGKGKPPEAPPVDPPAPAAAKPKKGSILKGLVLRQHGKVVEGKPVSDNYAVSLKDGVKDAPEWGAIIAELKETFPDCVFTWMAKAVKAAKGK